MSDEKPQSLPRFVNGKLVMLSRKNQVSGNIPYFKISPLSTATVKPSTSTQSTASWQTYQSILGGQLERGVPVLLTKDPELVPRDAVADLLRYGGRSRDSDKNLWRVTFLLEEQLYVMILTNRQFNHELVKAVPRRLTKDYTNGAAKNSR